VAGPSAAAPGSGIWRWTPETSRRGFSCPWRAGEPWRSVWAVSPPVSQWQVELSWAIFWIWWWCSAVQCWSEENIFIGDQHVVLCWY
jgi:hypothetical protein